MDNSLLKLAVCVAVALSVACKSATHKSNSLPPFEVKIAVARVDSLCDRVVVASSIQPIRSATIEPRVSGYLGRVHFEGGDVVKQGELLFEIDPLQITTQLYEAEASVEAARAQFIEARNNYTRAQPLVKINAISHSDYDGYVASYQAAKAALKSAEQQLSGERLNISYTTITSPISGVVAETPAAVGDYVGVATEFETLTTVEAIDSVDVDIAIPTASFLRYSPSGADSDLLSNIELILPDSSIYEENGRFVFRRQKIGDSASSEVLVARFANPQSLLRSQMFVRVRSGIGALVGRVMIPQVAVTELQGECSVWVVGGDSCVTFRPVTVGAKFGNDWEITSGLDAGESVATSAQMKLHEGDRVRPQLMVSHSNSL